MAGLCEHGYKPSGFITGGEVLYQVRNY